MIHIIKDLENMSCSISANVLGFVAVGEIEFVQPVQMPIKDTEFKLEQNAELQTSSPAKI